MEKSNQVKPHSVYDLVTQRIIALLEKGVVPWKKTWSEVGLPQNLISRKYYRGINVLLLSSLNFQQNYFLTYRQASELGGTVRKGERGNIVVFSKWTEENGIDKEEKVKRHFLRYHTVFNIAQCDGIQVEQAPITTKPNDPIGECERIIERMPLCPPIRFIKDHPYYNPVLDYINMPELDKFDNSESYYETLFHELTHSTGHQTRLNRDEVTNNKKFGSIMYSMEELTAEIGCCFLKSMAGFAESVRENNTSYLKGWLKVLRNDKRFIVYASAQAQRAVDYIMNIGSL